MSRCIAYTKGGTRCKNTAKDEGLCATHINMEDRRQLYCDLCARHGGSVAGPNADIPPPPPMPLQGFIPPPPPMPLQGFRPSMGLGRPIITAQDLSGIGLRHRGDVTERAGRDDAGDALLRELGSALRTRGPREFEDPLNRRVLPPFYRPAILA